MTRRHTTHDRGLPAMRVPKQRIPDAASQRQSPKDIPAWFTHNKSHGVNAIIMCAHTQRPLVKTHACRRNSATTCMHDTPECRFHTINTLSRSPKPQLQECLYCSQAGPVGSRSGAACVRRVDEMEKIFKSFLHSLFHRLETKVRFRGVLQSTPLSSSRRKTTIPQR